jgi:predicted nucleic acid-binding protein
MNIRSALAGVKRLYIESAPIIYYVEEHPNYIKRMDAIVDYVEIHAVEAVSSVILLTEVLNQPLRLGRVDLEEAYRDILLNGGLLNLVIVTAAIAESAARLRARYNLRTPDALHLAAAIESTCDAFLTNDLGLKRVREMRVLVLDEFDPEPS